MGHGGQNNVVIEITYIPHICVSKFLQGEQRDANYSWVEHLQEFVPLTWCKKIDYKQSPWTYLVWFQNLQTLSISNFWKF
jgi:hypothetical protein